MNDFGKLPNESDDLHSLVRATLDDIGAIFHVLAERQGTDTTAISLCNTGSFLCDKWAGLICSEIDSLEGANPTLFRRQMSERLLQVNLPAKR